MDCPFCGHDVTKVLDTRTCRGDRVRKRRCVACGGRFSTAERITVEYMQVLKRDGRTEPFSRAKLRRSLLRAVAGLAVSTEDIDTFLNRILEILQPDAPDLPVPSKDIGELVLQQMQSKAPAAELARIRYAMAFLGGVNHARGFRGVDDLLDWLGHEYGPPRVTGPATAGPDAVLKRSGRIEQFQLDKLSTSVTLAAEGRGTDAHIRSLAQYVASAAVRELCGQSFVTSQQIAAEALKALRNRDAIAYLRYAMVAKRYQSIDDLWLDALALKPV